MRILLFFKMDNARTEYHKTVAVECSGLVDLFARNLLRADTGRLKAAGFDNIIPLLPLSVRMTKTRQYKRYIQALSRS